MAPKKCHPLLQYNEDDIQNVLKELNMNQSEVEEHIEAIIDWFNKQPHLSQAGIDPDLVERLLIMAKGSREKTKRKIDNFYKYKALAPDIIQNRIKLLDSDLFSFHRQCILPKLYDGRRISLLKITDPDLNKFNLDDLLKLAFMIGDIKLTRDYTKGEIWILDFKGISFSHLTRINPLILQRGIQLCQEGMGMRFKEIHIINAPSIAVKLAILLKQFLKPKIMDKIIFHDDVEKLKEYIPKEYLPKDYGGDEDSIEETSDRWRNYLCSEEAKRFLIDCCSKISNERLRQNENNLEYVDGTFKKLNVD